MRVNLVGAHPGFGVQGSGHLTEARDTEVWVQFGKPENSSPRLLLDLTGMNLNQELRKAGRKNSNPEFLSSRYLDRGFRVRGIESLTEARESGI